MVFLGGIVFYHFGESLLQEVSAFFETIGIYSRTLDKMLMGMDALENLSDRDIIWEITKNNIWEKPCWGWGIAGELSYMNSYPHSIILEILLHYGIFGGSIALLIIFFSIIKSLFITKFRNHVLLIFLFSGFGHLFLSGTYLIEYKFWILFGICFSIMKKRPYLLYKRNEL